MCPPLLFPTVQMERKSVLHSVSPSVRWKFENVSYTLIPHRNKMGIKSVPPTLSPYRTDGEKECAPTLLPHHTDGKKECILQRSMAV